MSTKPQSRQGHQKLYTMIRENGGWEEFSMIQIKEFPCENTREAHMEEDRTMRELKARMNERRAYMTVEEQKERDQKSYQLNYEKNKEVICEKMRQYRIKNKEAINEKDRETYLLRKDKINVRKKEKLTCECGYITVRANITRHKKSERHINLMAKLANQAEEQQGN